MKLSDYFLKYVEFKKEVHSIIIERRIPHKFIDASGYTEIEKKYRRCNLSKKFKGIVIGYSTVKEGTIDRDWEDGNTFNFKKSFPVLQVKIGIKNKIILVDERDIKITRKFNLPVIISSTDYKRTGEYLGMEVIQDGCKK